MPTSVQAAETIIVADSVGVPHPQRRNHGRCSAPPRGNSLHHDCGRGGGATRRAAFVSRRALVSLRSGLNRILAGLGASGNADELPAPSKTDAPAPGSTANSGRASRTEERDICAAGWRVPDALQAHAPTAHDPTCRLEAISRSYRRGSGWLLPFPPVIDATQVQRGGCLSRSARRARREMPWATTEPSAAATSRASRRCCQTSGAATPGSKFRGPKCPRVAVACGRVRATSAAPRPAAEAAITPRCLQAWREERSGYHISGLTRAAGLSDPRAPRGSDRVGALVRYPAARSDPAETPLVPSFASPPSVWAPSSPRRIIRVPIAQTSTSVVVQLPQRDRYRTTARSSSGVIASAKTQSAFISAGKERSRVGSRPPTRFRLGLNRSEEGRLVLRCGRVRTEDFRGPIRTPASEKVQPSPPAPRSL